MLPRLAQVSLNTRLYANLTLEIIHVDVVAHFDAVGSETFVQLKALNPLGLQLFKSYGCSIPEICSGWGGHENFMGMLSGDIFLKILRVMRKPVEIPGMKTKMKLDLWGIVGLC